MSLNAPKIIKDTYKGFIFLVLLALVTGILFFFLEGRTFADSIYWSLVTMTTVGYGDIYPTTGGGKAISVFLASTGVVLYGYLGGLIVSSITESNLAEVFGMKKCDFKDHYIICGWTTTSEVVLSELMTSDRKIAVITEEKDDVPKIKRATEGKNIFPIYGDPSSVDVLEQAGVYDAKVILLCTDDDSKNLITTIHLKKLNPKARIIVKTTKGELKETLEMAGVTYVASPHELSGRLIASAAFEPDVANLLEDLSTATFGYDIRQYSIPKPLSGNVSVLEKKLKKICNVTLMGIVKRSKKSKRKVEVNPAPGFKVNAGDQMILLGNEKEFQRLEREWNIKQGR